MYFFHILTKYEQWKKYTYVQTLFFLLANLNLPTSIYINPFQSTLRTSIKKMSISIHFNQLQSTSTHSTNFNTLPTILTNFCLSYKKKIQPTLSNFNLLQPALIHFNPTHFNKKISTSTYFNPLLLISTNFINSPTHIFQRK